MNKSALGMAALLLVAGTAVLTWRINAALNSAELADLNATIGALQATIDYQNLRLQPSLGPICLQSMPRFP